MAEEPEAMYVQISADLSESGFDICHPFNVRWYNQHIAAEKPPHLQPLRNYGRDSLPGVLVGNSRAIWPKFLRWLAAQPDPDMLEPVDTFVKEAIGASIARACGTAGPQVEVYWSHEVGERLVSMQRVASISGLCYHDKETQLSIHPIFGAWAAFRAVVVFDSPAGPLGEVPPPQVRPFLTQEEASAARAAMAAALAASNEANLCTQLHDTNGMSRSAALAWVALRDCVRIGREHRYTEDQIEYHYTKDKSGLRKSLEASALRVGTTASLKGLGGKRPP